MNFFTYIWLMHGFDLNVLVCVFAKQKQKLMSKNMGTFKANIWLISECPDDLSVTFPVVVDEANVPRMTCLLRIVYPKKYAHGFCFAVLCCGYTLTDFPISIRLTSLALWQSNDCPSASKATLMNMDKYLMWIHYERLHNHNKAKHNKAVCIFLGIYCIARLIISLPDIFRP